MWSIEEIDDDRNPFGKAKDGLVVISPQAPCEMVADIARHEWMHLQQRRHHDSPKAYYGGQERVELIADCGSMLLGSTVTPYLDPERHAYIGQCQPGDYAEARRLIDWPGWRADAQP
ncbi:MAG: hypothetical protein GEU86_12485 [Actinophytocola sp.]|nr:hypothetical protein [Actinophytocola sp.]